MILSKYMAEGVYMPLELSTKCCGGRETSCKELSILNTPSAMTSAHRKGVGMWGGALNGSKSKGSCNWAPEAQWTVPERMFMCFVTKRVTEVVMLEMRSRTLGGQGRWNYNESKPSPQLRCIASIYKETVLSGTRQHSLACQVQNLIACSQLSLLFNLVTI